MPTLFGTGAANPKVTFLPRVGRSGRDEERFLFLSCGNADGSFFGGQKAGRKADLPEGIHAVREYEGLRIEKAGEKEGRVSA